ncbi:MAG: hypothetical protein RLZZ324_981 [Candidatus Parcubacteria bacterium]|jgi:hypothetical protein
MQRTVRAMFLRTVLTTTDVNLVNYALHDGVPAACGFDRCDARFAAGLLSGGIPGEMLDLVVVHSGIDVLIRELIRSCWEARGGLVVEIGPPVSGSDGRTQSGVDETLEALRVALIVKREEQAPKDVAISVVPRKEREQAAKDAAMEAVVRLMQEGERKDEMAAATTFVGALLSGICLPAPWDLIGYAFALMALAAWLPRWRGRRQRERKAIGTGA